MKQLQRLLFLQGNKCFFCGEPIPESQASVEHPNALSNGGQKADENSVVCCKAVNAALGNLTVKEKFRAVLSHKGGFICPAQGALNLQFQPEETVALAAARLLPQVVDNLRKRGSKRPSKPATLRNAIAGSFPQVTPEVVEAVLILLKEQRYTAENGSKVSYPGLEGTA